VVRAADESGLDVVGIQDHPYQGRFLDTWSLIGSLLAQTERVSMFTDVANLPLRPPAMMAKAAATLDVLSSGRFDLGLGAGAFPEIVARLGGPVRTRGESIEALEEAIDVLRLMWSDAPAVSYDGTYYQLADARPAAGTSDRDLAGRLQAAHAAPRRPQGRRLAAVARRPHARRATRRQRTDRRVRRAGRPRPTPDPADPESPGPDRRRSGACARVAAGRLPGRRAARRPARVLGRTLSGFVADGFDTLVFWPVDASRAQVELLTEVRRTLIGGDAVAPVAVTAYFEADARRDHDAVVALFSDDAEVVDERQSWRGRDQIRAWRAWPASKYTYTTEIATIAQTGPDRYGATGRLEGNFPGATVELSWDFTIARGLITRLEIAP
jgi:Luciferase-like monooxygenase/SnoaL-like domain